MHGTSVIRGLLPIDLKNVRRDPLLRWLIFLAPLMALALRWATPLVAARLQERYGFDLRPYYPLIASFMAATVPNMAGVVIGFLLLDQRDDQTLSALQVTPLSLTGYLAYRMAGPLLLSIVLTFVSLPMTGLVHMNPFQLLVVSVGAAPIAPLYALFLGGFANNKVQGFALMKAAGIINWPPLVAYFVATPWQWLFGIVPTYWPVKLVWMFEAGEGGWWVYLVIGLAFQMLLARLLMWRFSLVMYR